MTGNRSADGTFNPFDPIRQSSQLFEPNTLAGLRAPGSGVASVHAGSPAVTSSPIAPTARRRAPRAAPASPTLSTGRCAREGW